MRWIVNEGDNQRNYYLFKIGYDDDEKKCHWELIRKKNSREDRIKDGSCRSNHYDSNNTIKIKHSYDGVIAVYLNDRLLGTYEDDAQSTFRGSGVYVEERSNDRHIIIVFDDFVVRSL